jgi:cellobiose phosphorylase
VAGRTNEPAESRVKNNSVRVILGFYSSEQIDAEKAFQTIEASSGGRVHLFRESGAKPHAGAEAHYAALRLEGESLVVAETPLPEVQDIVKQLQGVGLPAVFVLREDLESLASAPGATEAPELQKPLPDPSKSSILARLRESELALEAARRDLLEAARLGHSMTAAAEWLLDNAYLIRTQIAETRRHLPRDYRKLLPGLRVHHNCPDVYALAERLVASTDHALTEANITDCLREHQTTTPLTIAELWFFPLMLRMALFESMARVAARVSRAQQLREAAYLWANRLAVSMRRGTEEFEKMLARMEAEPFALQSSFVTSLVERLQDEENALGPVKHWIEDRGKTPLTDLLRSEHSAEASERISTANAFGSLRAVSRIEYAKVFEAVSLVDAELRRDPAGVYAQSDFETRDRCRRAVERISLESGVTELDVAKRANKLAETQTTQAPYYLLAEGVSALEASVSARVPYRIRLIRGLRRHGTAGYLLAVAGLSVSFLALALTLAWEGGVHQRTMLAILGALALFPLGELSIQIVNALVISLFPPDILPKLDFEKGIPPEHATLVVVPMMLTSLEVVNREVERLEVRYLANREDNLFYGLFPDFTDASEPTTATDDLLLNAAVEGIQKLNARYPGGRFVLFHRRREWSESERLWIGRERKRGKLEDLNTLLAGQGQEEILVAGSLPLPIRYVITLDADTQLPVTAARRMIETIAHPLNRVEIDPVMRTRKRGFSIIQPRVSIALPGATATRFTRVFADTSGTDPYCRSVSDAQQDLFGEAIFHGKAIYDVQGFRTTVGDRFPAETLLSHDLIEGAHVGVALASDIELFENLPLTYASYCQRQHRWIRGDWQIAPWILRRVPAPDGKTEPNPLTLVNRWRILDNLRRTLVPVASLLLLLFGWLISAAPGAWSLVVGLAIVIPGFAPLLERLARHIQGSIRGWQGAADELIRAVVLIAFLPHQAWISMDAIARVVYRRYVSRHHLLQWQTAESAGAQTDQHTRVIFRQLLIVAGLSLVLTIVVCMEHELGPTSVFLALWIASPSLMRWLGRPVPLLKRARISVEDKHFLRRLARRTWRFFDDLVSVESHWLPPDNSQLALRVEVAQRTSPTNIGLWLTSALAAVDFGYLTVTDFLNRCTQTMGTLDRLERYEGHFLNWYNTRTLEPLTPRYVSTVDSGNLLASMWVFERGCQELLDAPLLSHDALHGIADTLGVLREETRRDRSMAVPVQALRRLLRGKLEGQELLVRLRMAHNLALQLEDNKRWKESGNERAYWTSRLQRELAAWIEMIDGYLPWMETLTQPPDSFLAPLAGDIVGLRRAALRQIPSLRALARAPAAVNGAEVLGGSSSMETSAPPLLYSRGSEAGGRRMEAAGRESEAGGVAVQSLPHGSGLEKAGLRAGTNGSEVSRGSAPLQGLALPLLPSRGSETASRGSEPAPASGGVAAVEAILAWRGTPGLRPEVAAWIEQLHADYTRARDRAASTLHNLEALAASAARFASGINMRFLYDADRRLFGVGYAVGGPVVFSSHYDLLASECRLASLVAIAKGDVPVEHWYALGRARTSLPGGAVLLSWSGTMFEYLMPLLFMRTFANSLLDHDCREAVRQQIAYGHEKDIPWGISECAYGALDANQIYQYRAFGVPSLALKPDLENELAVAPYATMLALLIDPAASVENLKRLAQSGFDGPMGPYESIDFNLENTKNGKRGVVIYAYMAHHQGMSLAALDDVLHRDVMVERFHGDVRVRAFESLLFERIPIARPPAEPVEARNAPVRSAAEGEPADRLWREDTATPRVHLQGNGRYALMVTNSGGSHSRWNEFDLTRWRSDTTLDRWGSFIYIRDLRSDSAWSAALQPLGGGVISPPGATSGATSGTTPGNTTTVRFSADRAEFTRRIFGIETIQDVTVAADDDAELRRLTVTNRSLRSRQLEFTSYLELSLTPHRTDTSHPVFAKMFVETECPEPGVLLAWRRARSPEDAPIWAAHVLTGAAGAIEYGTDRSLFLGRGNNPSAPESLRRKLAGTAGAVLDPIFSLRCRVTLEPRQRVELTFVTLAAASREAVLALVAKYQHQEAVARAFELAWTRAQLQFRYLGIGPAEAHRFQELASHLLYPNARMRPQADQLTRNRLGQSGLWQYGISGDLPMLAVTVRDARHLPLVRELLLAQTYWRWRSFKVDLIILDQEGPSYDLPLRQQLLRQIEAHSSETGMDRPGGVFLRDWSNVPQEQRDLFLSVPSVVLGGNRGSLQQQLVSGGENPPQPAFVATGGEQEVPSTPLPFLELPYFNGLGGFTQDGREYAIYLKPGGATPAPWSNVMASRDFGTLVTESGLGFTWRGNSQMNRLTPWHNDPVSDPQSEAIYLRDEESGAVWTPTPLPIREKDAYRARHGQGYTVFEHNSHAIGQELTVFVPLTERGTGDPVKICRLRLRNDSGRQRRLTVAYFAEWVLGSVREDQQVHVQTTFDRLSGAILATQSWNGNHAGYPAFAAASPRATSYSGDRTAFLGRNNLTPKPAAMERTRLDNRTGAALDPAAALQLSVVIEPGHQMEVTFLLGQAESVEAARAIVGRYSTPEQVENALAATRQWWDARLSTLQVRTPQLSADLLLNRWLLYQSLSCRFWARSGLYQSSGAFGFRDQLQDSMALVYAAPELARAHILASAARQFVEGDVQHWWHSETGMGVRTRCSDDLIWLAFVTAQYVQTTGDWDILDEEVPFLEGPLLEPGQQERMFVPTVGSQAAPLWEHCRRALDHAGALGAHELPLIGNGDWNDGLNHVGTEGRGESVWMGWFLCTVLKSFAEVMEQRQPGIAAAWRDRAAVLAKSVERSSWDGEWYLRGFFDNGAPLGSHTCEEAQIDSLPQSWAVISGSADPAHARQAMASAERRLVSERDRLVCLFTPPFDHSSPHPGYIMGYPPGLRENGGQYTHGSLWMALARARMGEGAASVRLLTLMNPIEYSRNPAAVERYRGEPYVVAADVSAPPAKAGRAGWTWYTGSAAWMYRVWIEEVLGFRLRGDRLTIAPVIPEDWKEFEITYRYRSTVYEIDVRRTDAGEAPMNAPIQLVDDGGTHKMTVWIQRAPALPVQPVSPDINLTLSGSTIGRGH